MCLFQSDTAGRRSDNHILPAPFQFSRRFRHYGIQDRALLTLGGENGRTCLPAHNAVGPGEHYGAWRSSHGGAVNACELSWCRLLQGPPANPRRFIRELPTIRLNHLAPMRSRFIPRPDPAASLSRGYRRRVASAKLQPYIVDDVIIQQRQAYRSIEEQFSIELG